MAARPTIDLFYTQSTHSAHHRLIFAVGGIYARQNSQAYLITGFCAMRNCSASKRSISGCARSASSIYCQSPCSSITCLALRFAASILQLSDKATACHVLSSIEAHCTGALASSPTNWTLGAATYSTLDFRIEQLDKHIIRLTITRYVFSCMDNFRNNL